MEKGEEAKLVQLFDAELRSIMEIWSEEFADRQCGGYLTCRNRDFSLYDDKKGAWGQARHIFTYSAMVEYSPAEKDRWLSLAKTGIDFVFGKMMADGFRINYLTDREGNMLEGPISVFSDAFAILGLAKYISVSGDRSYETLLDDMFRTYSDNIRNPEFKDIAPNAYSRGILHHALFMISVNVACEVAGAIGLVKARDLLEYALDTVLSRMKDQEYGCILEKKKSNGDRIDSQDALFLNVGHVFESMWFAIDAARLLGRKELIPEIISISENTFRLGTDDGLIVFSRLLDHNDKSRYSTWKYEIAFDGNDKVSWSYAEAMVLFLYLYKITKDEQWEIRFRDHLDYVEKHFIDRKYGDWFHALNNDGSVKVDMKGSTVKDAYHIPRAYMKMISILKEESL